MKEQAIKILQEVASPVQLFNELVSVLISSSGNPNLIRSYNVRGYTPQGLESLRYDVMKHLGITTEDLSSRLKVQDSDLEVLNEELKSENKELRDENEELKMLNEDLQDEKDELQDEIDLLLEDKSSLSNPLNRVLREMNDKEKEGFKLFSQYPFLREKSCPNELKVLVSDSITAFHSYREKHEELFKMFEEKNESKEKIYAIASELLNDFELNRSIHKELQHYRDNGEILGEHRALLEFKLQKEVDAMTGDVLAKAKNNLKSNISKKKKALASAQSEEQKIKIQEALQYLEKKQALVNEKLKNLGAKE